MKTAKALVFDFGGTLDVDGVHWYDLWKEVYFSAGLKIDEKTFEEAYYYAEETLNKSNALDVDYKSLLLLKVDLQLKFIYSRKFDTVPLLKSVAQKIADFCYSEVLKGAKKSLKVLNLLNHSYKIAVVSNFYGNLNVILKELQLFDFFDITIDSKIENIRKPNPQIYLLAAKRLGLNPEDCIFIGDSYTQDIVPSKEQGFGTIMIQKKDDDLSAYTKADLIIKSIEKLTDYLIRKEILENYN
jgi:HAD superfamily hydrolase (TIGR01509 family)